MNKDEINDYFINLIGGNIEIIDVSEDVKKKAFPKKQGIDYKQLQMTNEGLFSVSGDYGSNTISNLIIKYYGTKNLIITDATANNGSDTIRFGLNFDQVNSIELNSVNYSVLKNNVAVYALENKIKIYNDDSLNLLNKLEQDVIFIDAPWTGKDYKKQEIMRLYLNNYEISEIFLKYKQNAKMFVFKVPYNYDFNYFIKTVGPESIHIHNHLGHSNRIKFKIIIVKY